MPIYYTGKNYIDSIFSHDEKNKDRPKINIFLSTFVCQDVQTVLPSSLVEPIL